MGQLPWLKPEKLDKTLEKIETFASGIEPMGLREGK